MWSSVVAITDNIIFILRIIAVTKIFVEKIGNVDFGAVNPLEAYQLRFILAKSIDMIIRCFAGFDGRG
jgi:hypothetical protein